MTFARRQTASGTSDQDTSSPVTATWSSPTLVGSFLVAAISGQVDLGTVTPPQAGWALIKSAQNGGGVSIKLYAYPNAPSLSGASAWAFSGTAGAVLVLAEYTCSTGGATDDSGSTSTGTNSTLASSSGTANSVTDLVIAAFAEHNSANNGSITISGPTNSFSINVQVSGNTAASTPVLAQRQTMVSVVDRIPGLAGSYSTQVTSNVNDTYCSVIATFSDEVTIPARSLVKTLGFVSLLDKLGAQ